MNVLDLFCGCGGISEGFRLAGFKIVGGIDSSEDAIRTFAFNFPRSISMAANLLDFDEGKIQEIFLDKEIDVIVGGPPCQGFSNANRWQKELADPRNKLFFEYLKFVEVLGPKAVVIENVRGILSKDDGYARERIISLLNDLKYSVTSNVLNAADYGVPQNRYRAFFIGIRKDVTDQTFDFRDLKKKKKVTVKEALLELYRFEKSKKDCHTLNVMPQTTYQRYLRAKDNLVRNHPIVYPAPITQERVRYVPQGGNWRDIPERLFASVRSNRHSSAFKRLDEADVSVTIDTGNAHSNYFHPRYNRIPTVREAARIQSFNDDFLFLGSRSSQYRQIGNAVPPLLAFAIAGSIKKILKENESN
jgi:DNA (cytosine-5)-methyltransferase 1